MDRRAFLAAVTALPFVSGVVPASDACVGHMFYPLAVITPEFRFICLDCSGFPGVPTKAVVRKFRPQIGMPLRLPDRVQIWDPRTMRPNA